MPGDEQLIQILERIRSALSQSNGSGDISIQGDGSTPFALDSEGKLIISIPADTFYSQREVDLWLDDIKLNLTQFLLVNGGLSLSIRTITSTATLDEDDYMVLANAADGDITVNLPAASIHPNRVYNIKKIDSSANTVTIDALSSEKIDLSATAVLLYQHENIPIQSNGTQWYIQ